MKLYQATKTFYWSALQPFDKDDSLTKITTGNIVGALENSKAVYVKNRIIPVELPSSLISANFILTGTIPDPAGSSVSIGGFPDDYRGTDTFVWDPLSSVYVTEAPIDIGATGICYNQLMLYVSYTRVDATDLRIKVEFSPDNAIWCQETAEAASGTTPVLATSMYIEHIITSTGNVRIAIPICDAYYRISAKETSSGAYTDGAVTITTLIGRA